VGRKTLLTQLVNSLLLPLEYVGKCAPSGRWMEFEEHVSSKFAECGTMLQKGLVTLLV